MPLPLPNSISTILRRLDSIFEPRNPRDIIALNSRAKSTPTSATTLATAGLNLTTLVLASTCAPSYSFREDERVISWEINNMKPAKVL
ncbi:hypothetical protein ACLMJK_009241 [Lecanora helva]